MDEKRCPDCDTPMGPRYVFADYGKCARCGTPNSTKDRHGYTNAGYACPDPSKPTLGESRTLAEALERLSMAERERNIAREENALTSKLNDALQTEHASHVEALKDAHVLVCTERDEALERLAHTEQEARTALDALHARVDAAERERDAYRRAKAENDERYMIERDEARAERDAAVAALATARAEGERAFAARALDAIGRAAWVLVADGARPSRDRDMRRDGYTLGAMAAWRIVRDLHEGREPEDTGPTAAVMDAIETGKELGAQTKPGAGRAVFNVLLGTEKDPGLDPTFAESIRGTMNDSTYADGRLCETLAAWREKIRAETESDPARHRECLKSTEY